MRIFPAFFKIALARSLKGLQGAKGIWWLVHDEKHEKPYFWNTETSEVQWTVPAELKKEAEVANASIQHAMRRESHRSCLLA